MDRYCRICFNSKMWREPSGEAAKLEVNSYAHQNGYGHEEWLFNYETLFKPPGEKNLCKYAYVQPVGKYYKAYAGQKHNLLMYTVGENKNKFAVCTIKDVYVPEEDEINQIRAEASANGLIDQMIDQPEPFRTGEFPEWHTCAARHVFNIRFRPDDVYIFDPFRQFEESSRVYRSNRYQPLKWDIAETPSPARKILNGVDNNASDEERSEAVRHKCTVMGMSYTPQHVRLQNLIFRFLKKRHGPRNVFYEKNYVDLTLVDGQVTVFYEIKVLPKVKSCIRQALGQVLEYSHYANRNRPTN